MDTNEQGVSTNGVFKKAASKALCGGVAGLAAQTLNVVCLMWMQTIMNVQYRFGGTFTVVARRLYREGGIVRFYRGFAPAIFLAPLTRFGDVAANEGALALFQGTTLPMPVKTAVGSLIAASGRAIVMPLDSWKTNKQVQGVDGLKQLGVKFRKHPFAPWHGALGSVSAALVGNYPWFVTNNFLRQHLPQLDIQNGRHVRNAAIGFASSFVSDTCSNSLRVLKTFRQTSMEPVSYAEAARIIIAQDGYRGLFGRGLKTRIATKGVQGATFTVGWQSLQGLLEQKYDLGGT
eukprot:TRINITY_DN48868_c0_g1_i1.p1 TRINITY_DN48868_c0_g1~~TRINITY_DN48868_c0_g1_i1.p1  ORF type:complete len:290 (+),score=21.66 TRINITY_DN48868_c0_g1_i1:165-1034(+)